ncbi:MAG: hypothetical protein MSA65_03160 [Mollicutes bacterium]|nr:hypothetical protein [Mollicutes bacterium]
MYHNVVIGKPLVPPQDLIAFDNKDWEENEKRYTLFTENRFLPAIMKEAGIVKSIGEVRRNRPEFIINLDKLDCLWIKWGKHFIYIVVGE